MKIPFSKMHGCGNDFVVIDARRFQPQPWKELSARILDRRFGVGADQLLVLLPSESSDVKMAIFERDGAESEMCGNGIRCIARYLSENGDPRKEYSIETLGGKKRISVESFDRIGVDMGVPVLDQALWGKELEIGGKTVRVYCLSMGNPHAVVFLNREEDLEMVQTLGPKIETHSLFPNRTNVEFVHPKDRKTLQVRVWERGAGETYCCGTGACAAAVAAITEKHVDSPVRLLFKGGELEIAWTPGQSVFMTGPATQVYTGKIEI